MCVSPTQALGVTCCNLRELESIESTENIECNVCNGVKQVCDDGSRPKPDASVVEDQRQPAVAALNRKKIFG